MKRFDWGEAIEIEIVRVDEFEDRQIDAFTPRPAVQAAARPVVEVVPASIVPMVRRGPARAVRTHLDDGRLELACGHRVPRPLSKGLRARVRCCFCEESPRAAYWREQRRRREAEKRKGRRAA